MRVAIFLSFVIGFFAASPVGPMGLLCLRRTLSQGFTSGIVSALGISCAYAFWAFTAAHGVASFSHWIEQEKQALELAIGLFFSLYGLHGIFNTPNIDYPALQRKGRLAEFFSTFFVVLINPTTFLMFTALFTLFGIAKSHFDAIDSLEIALSVLVGALMFWLAVSHIIHAIRKNLEDSIFKRISQVSAFVIMIFGIVILLYSLIGGVHA